MLTSVNTVLRVLPKVTPTLGVSCLSGRKETHCAGQLPEVLMKRVGEIPGLPLGRDFKYSVSPPSHQERRLVGCGCECGSRLEVGAAEYSGVAFISLFPQL